MKKTLLLIVLALGMFSINVNAQTKKRTPTKAKTSTKTKPSAPTTEKTYEVEKDGFEWYRVTTVANGEKKYGAEDRYGNMIIPTEYSYVYYDSDDNPLLAGFRANKGKFNAWYSKGGKCIVPYTRGYTSIYKHDDDEFGTYYTFEKPDGGGILDRNGKVVASVKVDSLSHIYISSLESNLNGKRCYYLSFSIKKGGEKFKCDGIADVNGEIVVDPGEFDTYRETYLCATYRLTNTTNPLAGNRHETLAEAQAGPSGGNSSYSSSTSFASGNNSSSNNSGGGTSTVVVEHHRDPVPVQEWVDCTRCGGSGICSRCSGSCTIFIGDNLKRCTSCGGQGKCSSCAGKGGRYFTVYR